MATKSSRIGRFRYDYQGSDSASLKRSISNRLIYTVGKDPLTATDRDWFHAAAYAVRDRLIERWMETMRSYYRHDAKRVYYLSLEFLMGRALSNSLHNLGIYDEFGEALDAIGIDIRQLEYIEDDAGLGNGGLGRLAACFLDSMATLRLPSYGYGIRYEYGMFTQRIEDGRQVEHPENWLRYGNPWEFARPEVLFPVRYFGHLIEFRDQHGRLQQRWEDCDQVMAMAFDTPIPGYNTNTVNNLRLWAARATRDFELKYFNEGNYIRAVEEKNESENISRVLYPDDTTEMGRELRLMQQYFFVSASLQDILYRYEKHHSDFDQLPDKVAIQLNDTHPSIAIAELMRILIDEHGLEWDHAWRLTTGVFSYTNHTLMPEALESWPVPLFEKMLPRHLRIIYDINYLFLEQVARRFPGDHALLRRVSLIEEGGSKRIRMAHLAIVGSHHVNGVAALHTELMKETIFADFHRIWPERIINVTNGITPRRWLNQANKGLSKLITQRIGHGWESHLTRLRQLEPHIDDAAFLDTFQAVKLENKRRLAEIIQMRLHVTVTPDSLFDVHVKRIHEYKRQLLNLLHVITRYNRIRNQPDGLFVPRTVIFSGKAAPAYVMAKLIIRLINAVADTINNDPLVGERLKVVFLPNYDVSVAEEIIPAADLSQQISTAGTEASGTGNMKLALNGAITIGTLDGANIEMLNEVGEENMMIFGHTASEVEAIQRNGYRPLEHYHANAELRQALDMIRDGFFSPRQLDLFSPIFDALTRGDRYLVLADYPAYIATQERVDQLYNDKGSWSRAAALNVARMGHFSSDRTIGEYASRIWGALPVAHD